MTEIKSNHFIITDGVFWSRIGDRSWDPESFKDDPRIIVHAHNYSDMVDMKVIRVESDKINKTHCLVVKSLCSKTSQLEREVLKATNAAPSHISFYDVSLPFVRQSRRPQV